MNPETEPPGGRSGPPLITLEDITARIRDRLTLQGTSWQIREGENWAVFGPNGSGKTSLVGILVDRTPYVRGRVIRHHPAVFPERIGYLSFELLDRLMAREERTAAARAFSGDHDGFTPARNLVLGDGIHDPGKTGRLERLATDLGIRDLLDIDFRRLSTGEIRKLLIVRAVFSASGLLVLDEPFEGLDREARLQVREFLSGIFRQGIQMILVTHRFSSLPPEISHVLCLRHEKIFSSGPRERVLRPEIVDALYGMDREQRKPMPPVAAHRARNRPAAPPLVVMKNTTVRYGDRVIIHRLDWTMKADENWAILGPNGAGKSTLLSLITGDNSQVYANEIYLFGRRRGSGETVWDIKRDIGHVSSEFQNRYRAPVRVRDLVLSGFYDSIGLFVRPGTAHREAAGQWIDFFGLTRLADRRSDRLSYGEKRLALLARAMVKGPRLLILDEPCQGLDRSNRKRVLALIDRIAEGTDTRLLFVTHHEDEIPGSVTRTLRLPPARPEGTALS
jgi:molybdate transport system ATP-binding protein